MRRYFIPTLLLLAFAGVALAGISIEAYRTLGTRPSEDVTDGDGNESADLGTALAGRVQSTGGNPTIAVTAEFGTASATCVITVALLDSSGAVVGLQQSTATASRFRTAAAGDYVAPTLMFDTLGAPQYEVRHDDPSSGTVDLRAWVLGAKPE